MTDEDQRSSLELHKDIISWFTMKLRSETCTYHGRIANSLNFRYECSTVFFELVDIGGEEFGVVSIDHGSAIREILRQEVSQPHGAAATFLAHP
jgi:hypothetical protein